MEGKATLLLGRGNHWDGRTTMLLACEGYMQFCAVEAVVGVMSQCQLVEQEKVPEIESKNGIEMKGLERRPLTHIQKAVLEMVLGTRNHGHVEKVPVVYCRGHS